MRDTIKAVLRLYLIGMIWYVVMWGTSLALLGPVGAISSAVDVSPVVQTLFTLGIAVSAATIVAGLCWMRLRARPEPEARRTAGDFKDVGPARSSRSAARWTRPSSRRRWRSRCRVPGRGPT